MERLKEACEDYPNLLKADGYDKAIVGIGFKFNTPSLVYDKRKVLLALAQGGMTEEEAEEFFDFNIQGAYMGEHTPIFVETFDAPVADKKRKRKKCSTKG